MSWRVRAAASALATWCVVHRGIVPEDAELTHPLVDVCVGVDDDAAVADRLWEPTDGRGQDRDGGGHGFRGDPTPCLGVAAGHEHDPGISVELRGVVDAVAQFDVSQSLYPGVQSGQVLGRDVPTPYEGEWDVGSCFGQRQRPVESFLLDRVDE